MPALTRVSSNTTLDHGAVALGTGADQQRRGGRKGRTGRGDRRRRRKTNALSASNLHVPLTPAQIPLDGCQPRSLLIKRRKLYCTQWGP